MRKLLVCPNCRRQYDATSLSVGARFRCRCGTTMTVPTLFAHDAAVIRCASCGAPKDEGATVCSHCGSTFTLQDQDLDTICPSCLARISNSARFCHHCGTPIAPEEIATRPTDRVCPACGAGHLLRSRALATTGFSTLECPDCTGLWLGEDVFEHLEDKERAAADPSPDIVKLRAEVRLRPQPASPSGPFYRPCPVCSTAMLRFNFEQMSGIVLDRCRDHGIWFDANELEAALHWIRGGGERLLDDRRAAEERARASQERFRVVPKAPEDARQLDLGGASGGPAMGALSWIVSQLIKR